MAMPKATGGWMGITDKYWAAALVPPQGAGFETLALPISPTAGARYQSDFRTDTPDHRAGGAASPSQTLVFAGAKAGADHRRLRGTSTTSSISTVMIDWGWFYFITKPMFWLIDYLFKVFGNFGIAILATTVVVKLNLLPAGQQVLCVDGQHEEGAAQARGAQGQAWRRQDGSAEGHDGAPTSEEKINPVARLLAGSVADPGCSLRSTRCSMSPSKCAMRRSSAGSRNLSAAPIRPPSSTCLGLLPYDCSAVPDDRRLAADHGRHHVPADAHEPDAAGSDPGDDLHLDAGGVHLHAGDVPGRTG